ncbi:MAG TPA: efflux RND transporter periplasmic adaptor subunit [Thermoanaerobaculia bacterium]|nr:efflux RND transporter periplasmic adaptor subunit [Thermoanaerobaculia bacterium]
MRNPIVITLTIALAAFGCAKKEEAVPATTSAAAPALPSDVQAVSATATAATESAAAAADSDTIVATGEFVTPTRSELSAKMPGRIAAMYVDEGTRVHKGQPVLQIETDYTRINLQRAEADAARAKAAAEDARRDLERKKELIAKDSIPRATYDRSEGNYDQAKAAVLSANAQASLLAQQLKDATLRSPIEGVVAEKRTDVGQRLGDNTVALVIVQTSPLKLRFRVPERYLGTVKRGQHVSANVDPYPNESFDGAVTVIGGVIDPATRTFAVETEFANRDARLKPGLFARVAMKVK